MISELDTAKGLTHPRENRLLRSLPDAEYRRIAGDLRPVHFESGYAIHHPHGALDCFYFIADGFASLMYTTCDGHTAEISLVGREGGIGVTLFLGGTPSQIEAIAQVPVTAWCLPKRPLRDEFARAGPFQHSLLIFTQALMAQMAQTVVCNRHHSVTLQLSRWLLLSLDRLPNDDIPMTHETIARMLGVRRPGITEAAKQLQREGLIEHRRGNIHVVDRRALESRVCECYGVIRDEYDRLAESL
ncbi:MAG: Crp/Fnr family transcriptional regulator [Halofilum sp. (in: g-proteobacteria)]|nr:Crp/Fnr family transcriptional regulator [Halofilum sp. (in: g-proteobacteria)]